MNPDADMEACKPQRKICPFYVINKRRFCRMTVGVGFTYCGEHISHENLENKDRIPCPYDNRHSCYAKSLRKHLKKCNSRPTENPCYISKDINNEITSENPTLKLADIETDDLNRLLDKIKSVYEGLNEAVREEIIEHPALNEAILDPKCGFNARKHLIQNSSLIGHFHKLNLSGDLSIIEFGAGKGQLTYWLAKSVPNPEQCQFIVVDKSTLRHKSENKIKELSAGNVKRYRVDIADLCLSQLPCIISTGKCAAISKHLCGAATDFSLRCLVKGAEESKGLSVTGIVFAVCCHHRCEWSSYTGKEFLIENGFSPSDFSVMCGIASWATSGIGQRKHEQIETEEFRIELDKDEPTDRKKRLELGIEERTIYGKMCKMLVDYGRKMYLERNGFICTLKYYVQPQEYKISFPSVELKWIENLSKVLGILHFNQPKTFCTK